MAAMEISIFRLVQNESNETVEIIVGADSIQVIGQDGKAHTSSITTGSANFNKVRVIREEGNEEASTVPHYINEKGAIVIHTSKPYPLVITNRVASDFTDTKNIFSEQEIEDLFNYIITKGTTATTYSPKKSITWGEFSTMIAVH